MSETHPDDDDGRDDDVRQPGHVNGGPISDTDIKAMLDQERSEKRALKAELEQERTNRNRAEASATTHMTGRFDAEKQAVTSRLESAEKEALNLRKAYAEALAEGRFDEAAEVQDKMGELRAKQIADKQYATWLDGERGRAEQQARQQQRPQGVDLAQYSAKQRAWIRQNPEFMEDEKIRAKTFAGHQLAVADGIAVDSPEYFQVIDDLVHGKRRRDDDDDEPPRRNARDLPNDMPVSRRTATSTTRQREVKLSADEMEAADITNPDIPVQGHKDPAGNWVPGRYEKYAIQRAKLKARGG